MFLMGQWYIDRGTYERARGRSVMVPVVLGDKHQLGNQQAGVLALPSRVRSLDGRAIRSVSCGGDYTFILMEQVGTR